MIKLELSPKPTKLTIALQIVSTQKFKDTGDSVWNIHWLKKEIAAMSYGKCCYSEIRLGEESKYMEVEHFFPKDDYEDEVMVWGNLLPSCKKCNATKGEHDTKKEPIVNPFVDNPKDYLFIRESVYKEKNDKGRRTIKKLALNDHDHFLIPRSRIADETKKRLSEIHNDFATYPDINVPINRLKRLLKTGNRKEEYSALVATTILKNSDFQSIVHHLVLLFSKWDQELEELYTELEFCALLE